jgi:hypothetical protein
MTENYTLIFTDNTNIADLITKLNVAKPENTIITNQTKTMPNNTLYISGGQNWIKSFRADKITTISEWTFYGRRNVAEVILGATANAIIPGGNSISSGNFIQALQYYTANMQRHSIKGTNHN